MKDTFGERLEYIMDKKRISRKKLAKMIGVTVTSIGYYINNNAEPSTEKLIKIAKKLNVSLDFLCGLSNIDEIKDEHIKKIISNDEYYNLTKEIIDYKDKYEVTKKLFEHEINLRILKILIDLNERTKENVAQMLESLKN